MRSARRFRREHGRLSEGRNPCLVRLGRWGRPLKAAKPVAAVAAAVSLSGCDFGILDPQGPIGVAQKTILLNALVIMLAIIVPTITATLWFAFWFRSGNAKALYRPQWAYSGRLELLIWSIPLLTIMFLGGITWIGSHELDPARPLASKTKPLEVQVVSLDWKWLFIYPDQGVASVNQVVVPAATPVHFWFSRSLRALGAVRRHGGREHEG